MRDSMSTFDTSHINANEVQQRRRVRSPQTQRVSVPTNGRLTKQTFDKIKKEYNQAQILLLSMISSSSQIQINLVSEDLQSNEHFINQITKTIDLLKEQLRFSISLLTKSHLWAYFFGQLLLEIKWLYIPPEAILKTILQQANKSSYLGDKINISNQYLLKAKIKHEKIAQWVELSEYFRNKYNQGRN